MSEYEVYNIHLNLDASDRMETCLLVHPSVNPEVDSSLRMRMGTNMYLNTLPAVNLSAAEVGFPEASVIRIKRGAPATVLRLADIQVSFLLNNPNEAYPESMLELQRESLD